MRCGLIQHYFDHWQCLTQCGSEAPYEAYITTKRRQRLRPFCRLAPNAQTEAAYTLTSCLNNLAWK